jgi:hypothetical protein
MMRSRLSKLERAGLVSGLACLALVCMVAMKASRGQVADPDVLLMVSCIHVGEFSQQWSHANTYFDSQIL